jgi:hypothetical protein
MTNWQRLDAIAGAAVNSVFSEQVRITPRTAASEYLAALPDPDRAVVVVKAVFALGPEIDDLRGSRLSGETRGVARAVFADASIQITSAIAATIGYEPKKGDLIELIERPGSPSYCIEHVDPLDCDDLVVWLTKEKQH